MQEPSSCPAPVETLVRVLEQALAEAGVTAAEVVSSDIWELPPEMSVPIVDKMVEGRGFPMVLAGNRVVCTDGVDSAAVVSELAGESSCSRR